MIRSSRFRTVRARLLALMVFVIVPVAAMSIVLAFTTYRSVNASIEAAQIQSVSNYAVRTRLWFRGSSRTLVATVASIRSLQLTGEQCGAVAKKVVADIEGYQALQVHLADGISCFASKDAALTEAEISRLAVAQAGKALARTWAGPVIANARFDAEMIGTKLHLVVHARSMQSDPVGWHATLLVDPVLLDQAFEIGEADHSSFFALMKQGRKVVVA